MSDSKAHASLVAACVTYLALHKIRAYAINQVTRRRKDGTYRTSGAPPGFPDVVACVGGRFVGIECKTGNALPRPEQMKVLDELERAGAFVAVIRSVDQLAPIVRLLRGPA